MVLEEWTKRIATIKNLIERTMEHHYLYAFLEKSVVDEDRLFLLYNSLQEEAIAEDVKDIYITTAMLIDIALNIHDNVPNTIETSHLKQEQLKVLSGDYYSALYYKLLADVKDVSLIRLLASGIKIVNENKLNLYHIFENMTQVIPSLLHIESAITEKFYQKFQPRTNIEAISSFLLLKRLLKERIKLQENNNESLFQLTQLSKEEIVQAITTVDQNIKQLFDKLIHTKWNTMNDAYLNNRIVELKEQFYSVK